MSDYVTRIRTTDGDKQIDYNALANLPKLPDSGANAVKGSVSGAVIRLEDVSPVEHNVACQLVGNTMFDFSSVTVYRCGKNLNDSTAELSTDRVYNGPLVLDENSKWYGLVDIDTIPDVFTVSTTIICSDYGRVDGSDTSLRLYYFDQNQAETELDVGSVATAENPQSVITFNRSAVPEGTKYVGLRIRLNTAGYTTNTQIEAGPVASEYVPYIEGQTYTANADGTVKGMTSLAPSMTLWTDAADVVIGCEYERDVNAVIAELRALIGSGGSGSSARIANVSLLASKWQGTASPYSQVVSISGITANSQVDLTPSVEQLSIFHNKDLAFVTENINGIVTVYAIGDKPANDYTIQATITEVYV